ncbi:MAG: hypothetical protein M1272_00390 [Firmicutes bacterium]|nr:hypothetical protein [Bacillota bacterium]
MSWVRIVIEYVVAFLAMWVFQGLMPGFPKFGLSHIAVVSAAVALVAYALTEMPGGYASAYGRAVLAWIAGTSVMSMYFTILPRYTGHPFAYFESALAIGVIIGLTELVVAPKGAREAHGQH